MSNLLAKCSCNDLLKIFVFDNLDLFWYHIWKCLWLLNDIPYSIRTIWYEKGLIGKIDIFRHFLIMWCSFSWSPGKEWNLKKWRNRQFVVSYPFRNSCKKIILSNFYSIYRKEIFLFKQKILKVWNYLLWF